MVRFFVRTILQNFVVGNKLKILPDGSANEPGKRVEPIQNTKHFAPKYICAVALPHMYKFVTDDFL